MVNFASRASHPLNSVAQFLAGFADHVAEVFRCEGVRINVDVQGVVTLRTSSLGNDTEVIRIDAEVAQFLLYLIHIAPIQFPMSRKNSRAQTMSKRYLLARENTRVVLVVSGEDHVGCATGYTLKIYDNGRVPKEVRVIHGESRHN